MKTVNLLLLTRTHEARTISMLYHALSGREDSKQISDHEAASLWSLADRIAPDLAADSSECPGGWMSLLDGFYFSYVIEHIGKEFDLLKIAQDGSCILNIELKSEMIGEDRIKKQLEQNRYYLSHITGTIYSFTYVMETDQLYLLNEKGYLRECGSAELAAVLRKEPLRHFLADGIDLFFKAAEYLISPIASPEKFLQGKYFLTNQQFDFRKRILAFLQEHSADCAAPAAGISGTAGTGKTLLLLDLALVLSRKQRVLFVHSGPLRQGHLVIDQRLKNVDIIGSGQIPDADLSGYDYLLIDEADHLEDGTAECLLKTAGRMGIPVILSYDPHELLSEASEEMEEGTGNAPGDHLAQLCQLHLSFSGNIRINRPVLSFLRRLLHPAERSGRQDYSCIDVVYAEDQGERRLLEDYYNEKGYVLVSTDSGAQTQEDVIAREYDKVIMILDETFYYDTSGRLRAGKKEEEAIALLYEGLSRTRENLCLLVQGNRELFSRILALRLASPEPYQS